MEKKAAIALRDYVLEAKEVFDRIIFANSLPNEDFEQLKILYNEEVFVRKENDFEAELKRNIQTYNDNDIICAFLQKNFNVYNSWEDFEEEFDFYYRILELDTEIEFLFKLKKNIEHFLEKFNSLIGDSYLTLSKPLYSYLNSFKEDEGKQVEKAKPVYELRFDFDNLRTECAVLGRPIDKIRLVNERLYDFKQWQLQFDEVSDGWGFAVGENEFKYTRFLYPNFEKLCANEITRLRKQLDVEKDEVSMDAIKRNHVRIEAFANASAAQAHIYKWNSSDTDFVELFAALFHNQSIVRMDGKTPTRKEVLEYFQQIFNIEIKDVEGKLNKAGNRHRNTPFIDKLSQQFRNYVAEKERKSMSR